MDEQLRSWYREQLRSQIGALESARSGLRAGSPGVADVIRGIAHTLRGSGATYGFPQVSSRAAQLEEAEAQELGARLEDLIVTLRDAAEGEPAPVPEGATILLVEDDESIRRVLEVHFERAGYQTLTATTARRARELLAQRSVDVAVLDLLLPDGDGRDVLAELRSRPATSALPVIVLTIRAGGEPRARCEALGVAAYLQKPFEPATVVSAVATALNERRPTDGKRDPLSGLLSRAAFAEAFRGRFLDPGVERAYLALVDIDRFSAINDSCGRDVGDRILSEAADAVKAAAGRDTLVGRWAGDRFVLLLTVERHEGARELVEGVLQALRDRLFKTETRTFRLTASAGLTAVEPECTLDELVDRADGHLFRAKAGGRDRLLGEEDAVDVDPGRVLIADDDEAIIRPLRQRLEAAGFEVVSCDNGAAAFAEAHGGNVDLVLLDVMMPAMDGFEVLERIRQQAELATIPVVMLTSRGSDADVQRGFELGADDYLVKPISLETVVARVRKLLGRWVAGTLGELDRGELHQRAVDALQEIFDSTRAGEEVELDGLLEIAERLLELDFEDLQAEIAIATRPGLGSIVGHSVNVTVFAMQVGHELEMSEAELTDLAMAALLHEIGSTRLAPGLLERTELSDTEKESLRERPALAGEIIRGLGRRFESIATIAENVHERLDGSGYPEGRSGDEIPLGASIIGAVDVYEACIHERVYRPQTSTPVEGMQSIIQMAPDEFPQQVVKAMIRCIGLFPVGSFVQLSSGEIGRVLEHRQDHPMRPLLAILHDSRGKRLDRPKSVDLLLGQPVHVQRGLVPSELQELGVG